MTTSAQQNTNAYLWKIATLPEELFNLLSEVRDLFLKSELKGMKPKQTTKETSRKGKTAKTEDAARTESFQVQESRVRYFTLCHYVMSLTRLLTSFFL